MLKKLIYFIFTSVLLAQLSPQQLTLSAPPLPAVNGGNATWSANQGGNYYYWVIAVYTSGNAFPYGPIKVDNGPSVISASNSINVFWTTVGANSYVLLRTTTQAPPNGTCVCMVSSGITATMYTDVGTTLSAYTISSIGGKSGSVIAKQNDRPFFYWQYDSPQVYNQPIYYNNGNQLINLTNPIYYDIRNSGALPTASGTNADCSAAMLAAITAGYKQILLPSGCTWTLALVGGTFPIPDGLFITGESYTRSIIKTPNVLTDYFTLGAKSALQNLTIIDGFCTTSVTWTAGLALDQKVCPTHYSFNGGTSPVIWANWPNSSMNVIIDADTEAIAAGGYYDRQGIQITVKGGDAVYVGAAGALASGVRGHVTNTSPGAAQAFLANVSAGNAGVTNFGYSATLDNAFTRGYQAYMNVTGSTAFNVDDLTTTGGNGFAWGSSTRTSGIVNNYYHSTSAFTGDLFFANMAASGGGSFTGNYIRMFNAGDLKFNVASTGVTTIGGILYANRPAGVAGKGQMVYCTDCTVGACATPGTGAYLFISGVTGTNCPF